MFFLYTNSKKTKTKESQSQNDDEWKNKTNIMRRGERRRATAVRTDVTAHTSFPSPPLPPPDFFSTDLKDSIVFRQNERIS
jgi:hypothetical protein